MCNVQDGSSFNYPSIESLTIGVRIQKEFGDKSERESEGEFECEFNGEFKGEFNGECRGDFRGEFRHEFRGEFSSEFGGKFRGESKGTFGGTRGNPRIIIPVRIASSGRAPVMKGEPAFNDKTRTGAPGEPGGTSGEPGGHPPPAEAPREVETPLKSIGTLRCKHR